MFNFFRVSEVINTDGDDDLAHALRGAAIKQDRQLAREASTTTIDEIMCERVRHVFVQRIPEVQWSAIFKEAGKGRKGFILAGPRGSTWRVMFNHGKVTQVVR